MNKLLERIGQTITGMGLVTFALIMILIGMMVISHGLFVRIFSTVLEPSHASAAAWFLALGWEFTVLITTCNVKFVHRRFPLILSICSGVIVLFFINAFDTSQSIIEILTRLLVGCLITTINYVYAELFYSKWLAHNKQTEYEKEITTLISQIEEKESDLSLATEGLQSANLEIEILKRSILELEDFKAKELRKVTCSCGKQFESVYKLTSHKGSCQTNKALSLNGHKKVNFIR